MSLLSSHPLCHVCLVLFFFFGWFFLALYCPFSLVSVEIISLYVFWGSSQSFMPKCSFYCKSCDRTSVPSLELKKSLGISSQLVISMCSLDSHWTHIRHLLLILFISLSMFFPPLFSIYLPSCWVWKLSNLIISLSLNSIQAALKSKYGEVSCLWRFLYYSRSSNTTIFEGNKEKFSFCKCSTALHSVSHTFSDHLQEFQFMRVLLWLIRCYQVLLWFTYILLKDIYAAHQS
jgi:hypothetical protein